VNGKLPLTAHGVKDASTDAATITAWWGQWPNANVGIACGPTSGIVAIDIDGPSGEDSLVNLCGNPPAPTVFTSKGRHIYFQHPGNGTVVKNSVRLRPGLDIRSDDGYVVAPPSVHESGTVYTWDDENGLGLNLALPPLPDGLRDALSSTTPTMRRKTVGAELPETVEEGSRNHSLFRFGCRLRGDGCSKAEIESALLTLNARCKPPLADDEVTCIAASAAVYEVPGRKAEPPGKEAEAQLEPWPEPVDGGVLLDELHHVYTTFMVLPSGADVVLPLWTLYTWIHSPTFVSPRLVIGSPVRGCGKTRLMSVVNALTPRPLFLSNASMASLFRLIEDQSPTLLLDEGDTWLRQSEDVRNIVNAGWQWGTYVTRVEGEGKKQVKQYRVFAPIAIALIGRVPDTIEDRSIVIQLKKKLRSEPLPRWSVARPPAVCAELRSKCLRWATDHGDAIGALIDYPEIPSALPDRAADNWAPLLVVADRARTWWPGYARNAAVLASARAEEQDAGMRLLADIREIFGQLERLPTEGLLRSLHAIEGAPWGEWRQGRPLSAHSLARLLRPFGIRPDHWRVGTETIRGYASAAFADAWTRYCPEQAPTGTNGTPAQPTHTAHVKL
jgi:putative DNA primase/helicase